MQLDFIKKNRKIINAVIYAVIILGIAGLLYMNRSGKEYQMFNHAKVLTEENDVRTQKLTLPAGNYYMVVNYAVPVETPVTVYIDNEHQIEDTLTPSPEGDYYTLSFEVEKATSLFHLVFKDGAASGFELFNYEMSADKVLYNDDTYFAVVFVLLAAFLYMLLQCRFVREMAAGKKAILIALASLTLFASYPMFTDYLIYGHDIAGHLIRIEGVKDALLAGQFPTAVYPNINNGYGLLGFIYPNISLLFPAFLRICGVSMVTAYQSMMVLINVATTVAVYVSVKSMVKSEYAAVVASVLYVLAPYRLSDLYIRAALGESLAMIFLPLALAGLYHVFLGDKKKWYLLVLGYCGILQSHVLSCLMIAFVSVVTGILLIRHLFMEKRYLSLLKALGTVLVLNLWYLIPFLKYYSYPLGMGTIENTGFYEYTVSIGQLFMTRASTYIPLKTYEGIGVEMPLSVGMAGAVAFAVLLFYVFSEKKQNITDTGVAAADKNGNSSMIWLRVIMTISLLSVFLASPLFPWKRLSEIESVATLMGMIQFPFRLLTITTVTLALGCGLAIINSEFLNRYKKLLFGVLLVLSLISTYEILDEYVRQDVLVTRVSGGFDERDLPEYWPEGTEKETFQDTTPWANDVQISDFQKNGLSVSFSYSEAGENAFVALPMLYYPGYHAETESGEKLAVDLGEKNRVRVYLPQTEEKTTVKVQYSIWRLFD